MEKPKEGRAEKILLRVDQAEAAAYPQEQIEIAKTALLSYRARFGQPDETAAEPDQKILAQVLACAAPEDGGIIRIQKVLAELAIERRPCGYSWAWFVSVMLQRIHGIGWQALRQWRAGRKQARHAELASFSDDAIAAVAARKAMR